MTQQDITDPKIKNTVYGYFAMGNSTWDLINMLVEKMGGYEALYDVIKKDLEEDRKDAPETFETSAEEELQVYEQCGIDSQSLYNSPIYG